MYWVLFLGIWMNNFIAPKTLPMGLYVINQDTRDCTIALSLFNSSRTYCVEAKPAVGASLIDSISAIEKDPWTRDLKFNIVLSEDGAKKVRVLLENFHNIQLGLAYKNKLVAILEKGRGPFNGQITIVQYDYDFGIKKIHKEVMNQWVKESKKN